MTVAVAVALLGHDGNLLRLAILAWLARVAYAVQTGVARMLLENVAVAEARAAEGVEVTGSQVPSGLGHLDGEPGEGRVPGRGAAPSVVGRPARPRAHAPTVDA